MLFWRCSSCFDLQYQLPQLVFILVYSSLFNPLNDLNLLRVFSSLGSFKWQLSRQVKNYANRCTSKRDQSKNPENNPDNETQSRFQKTKKTNFSTLNSRNVLFRSVLIEFDWQSICRMWVVFRNVQNARISFFDSRKLGAIINVNVVSLYIVYNVHLTINWFHCVRLWRDSEEREKKRARKMLL